MKKNAKAIIVFIVSLSLISMEIIWTRIFSAEFFYTFAFLILSVSILGLGLGALAFRLFSKLNKLDNYWLLFSVTALLMLIGPGAVLKMGLELSQLMSSWIAVLKFILTVLILSSSFFTGGIILASVFRKGHTNMPRLYMSDLIGASLGVIFSVLLMNIAGTDKATFLIATPLIFLALVYAPRWYKIVPSVLIISLVAALPTASKIINKPKKEMAEVIFSHWDAMAKLKVFQFDSTYRGINIDNVANSPVMAFDGVWNKPDSLKIGAAMPVTTLIKQFDSCTFLSLGAGGGSDVLHALEEGATEVHAVEVNPYINRMMTKGFLNEFSGKIYNDPRVKVITEDARSYVRKFEDKFDIIYSQSSNTFAALASGSFALAENYLFTKEAFIDYYRSLTDNGYLFMEHQFYIPRMVSEVLWALKELGIENPEEHLAVYNLPQMRRKIILMGKKELTEKIINTAIHPVTAENYPFFHVLYPAADSLKQNPVNQIVMNGWESVQEGSPSDLSPCTDNRPFIAQQGMMKNFSFERLKKGISPYEFMGFPLSKLLIITILVIVFLLILPLNLLPYLRKGEKLNSRGWLYFLSIGIAFMAVEVILIQKYTWFIGSSAYTFMTILFVLLASSGLGSFFSGKFQDRTPFLFIAGYILAEIFVFPWLLGNFTGFNTFSRILISIILIAPLGFFMGMPFVKGSRLAGELIDWGFAVNGAASVLGSVLVLIPVFAYGFKAGLLVGLFFYLLAMLLLRKSFIAASKN